MWEEHSLSSTSVWRWHSRLYLDITQSGFIKWYIENNRFSCSGLSGLYEKLKSRPALCKKCFEITIVVIWHYKKVWLIDSKSASYSFTKQADWSKKPEWGKCPDFASFCCFNKTFYFCSDWQEFSNMKIKCFLDKQHWLSSQHRWKK